MHIYTHIYVLAQIDVNILCRIIEKSYRFQTVRADRQEEFYYLRTLSYEIKTSGFISHLDL